MYSWLLALSFSHTPCPKQNFTFPDASLNRHSSRQTQHTLSFPCIPLYNPRMGSAASPQRDSPHLRLHCVNVFVRDQDRSLRFFVEQLGFNVAFDTRVQSGERWVGVAPPDGAAILALIAPKPNSEQYRLIGRATQIVFVTE